MANDGTQWVTTEDIEPRDREVLLKLDEAVQELLALDAHEAMECFEAAHGRQWYTGCMCEECRKLNDRLELAQAELDTGFRSVAMTSAIADSDRSPGWRRVAAWLAYHTGEAQRRRARRAKDRKARERVH